MNSLLIHCSPAPLSSAALPILTHPNSRGDSDNVGLGAIKNRDVVTAPKSSQKRENPGLDDLPPASLEIAEDAEKCLFATDENRWTRVGWKLQVASDKLQVKGGRLLLATCNLKLETSASHPCPSDFHPWQMSVFCFPWPCLRTVRE